MSASTPARVRVKICGVTTPEEARAIALLGADALGLNFHPSSPRCVTTEVAEAMIGLLPPFVESVGIVVDRTPADLADLVEGRTANDSGD